MCLYPKLIYNKKYKVNEKNGGNVPTPLDNRCRYVPVGCGKCMECTKQRTQQWLVRLLEDIKENRNGLFVTLTFSDETLAEYDKEIEGIDGYDRDNEMARIGVRRFLERWRKKYKKSIRHWLVTELGQKKSERIHLHGILWNERFEGKNIQEQESIIFERWQVGNIRVGDGEECYLNEGTIQYMVKYINKADEKHPEYEAKIFTSPGIGKKYIDDTIKERNRYRNNGKTIETYKNSSGYELALPIYYRNYIYSDDEKEKLWIEKLDKEERWIDGERVCIKDGWEEYEKLLKEKRKKNNRLGFGDDEINWNRKNYEYNRRMLKRSDMYMRQFEKWGDIEDYDMAIKLQNIVSLSEYKIPD